MSQRKDSGSSFKIKSCEAAARFHKRSRKKKLIRTELNRICCRNRLHSCARLYTVEHLVKREKLQNILTVNFLWRWYICFCVAAVVYVWPSWVQTCTSSVVGSGDLRIKNERVTRTYRWAVRSETLTQHTKAGLIQEEWYIISHCQV
jgi:hypothetical protein